MNRQQTSPVAKGLLLLLCLLWLKKGSAQSETPLTLDSAIALSLANSEQLKSDSLSLLLAANRLQQGMQGKGPQFATQSSYLRISDNITPFQVALGGRDVVLNPQILDQSYNSVQARQLLWAGGRQRATTDLLNLDQQAAAVRLLKNKTDLRLRTTELWYALFVNRKNEALVRANIALLEAQRKDGEAAVRQGILLANELLKIDLAVTNLRTSLNNLQNSDQMLAYNLRLLTATSTDNAVVLPDILPEFTPDNRSLNDYVSQALAQRSDLQLLRLRKESAGTGIRLARSSRMPEVSVGGAYNYDRPNQRVFPNKAAFTGTWNAGVFLNWNLSGLYTAATRIKESKLLLQQTETSEYLARQGIAMEVNERYTRYREAVEAVSLAEKAVEQATENFRVEENRYRASTTTATDYLNANTALVQARINLVTAKANVQLSYRKLLQSINL